MFDQDVGSTPIVDEIFTRTHLTIRHSPDDDTDDNHHSSSCLVKTLLRLHLISWVKSFVNREKGYADQHASVEVLPALISLSVEQRRCFVWVKRILCIAVRGLRCNGGRWDWRA